MLDMTQRHTLETGVAVKGLAGLKKEQTNTGSLRVIGWSLLLVTTGLLGLIMTKDNRKTQSFVKGKRTLQC